MMAVVALMLVTQLGAKPAQPESSKKAKTVPVVTAMVESHQLVPRLTLMGKLEAQRSIDVAAQIGGQIAVIQVKPNQNVAKGQPLLHIDDRVEAANVAEAKAYLKDERRKLTEFTRLLASSAITQTEIDAQTAQVEMAEARLQAAQAQLAFHHIEAPFAGQVGLMNLSEGAQIVSGQSLLTLDDLSTMRLDLQVPERFLSQLNVGMPLAATAQAWPGEVFEGKVEAIDTRVDTGTLNLTVRLGLANPDLKLKPGMLLTSTLVFAPIDQAIVPIQALEYSGSKRYVYVVDATGIANRTEVVLGTRVESSVVIESGIALGQRIVVQGLVNMRDGLSVEEAKANATI